jgi:hypothetical protein
LIIYINIKSKLILQFLFKNIHFIQLFIKEFFQKYLKYQYLHYNLRKVQLILSHFFYKPNEVGLNLIHLSLIKQCSQNILISNMLILYLNSLLILSYFSFHCFYLTSLDYKHLLNHLLTFL